MGRKLTGCSCKPGAWARSTTGRRNLPTTTRTYRGLFVSFKKMPCFITSLQDPTVHLRTLCAPPLFGSHENWARDFVHLVKSLTFGEGDNGREQKVMGMKTRMRMRMSMRTRIKAKETTLWGSFLKVLSCTQAIVAHQAGAYPRFMWRKQLRTKFPLNRTPVHRRLPPSISWYPSQHGRLEYV